MEVHRTSCSTSTGMICGTGIPRSVPQQQTLLDHLHIFHDLWYGAPRKAPRRGSGDAKPLAPVPPVYFTCPGDRQGHPRRVQGIPSPWTQTPDLGHVTVEDQLCQSRRKSPGGRVASKESQEMECPQRSMRRSRSMMSSEI